MYCMLYKPRGNLLKYVWLRNNQSCPRRFGFTLPSPWQSQQQSSVKVYSYSLLFSQEFDTLWQKFTFFCFPFLQTHCVWCLSHGTSQKERGWLMVYSQVSVKINFLTRCPLFIAKNYLEAESTCTLVMYYSTGYNSRR